MKTQYKMIVASELVFARKRNKSVVLPITRIEVADWLRKDRSHKHKIIRTKQGFSTQNGMVQFIATEVAA